MEMNNSDHGLLEFTFGSQTVLLQYLVFRGCFYAVLEQDSELFRHYSTDPAAPAGVKVLESSNRNTLQQESAVEVELITQASRVQHIHQHLKDLHYNFYDECSPSLGAIRCSPSGTAG